ncbi:DUF4386 domain-containing protein [Scleromatobacter humisilvae]|uniref:DUF4386 domain-containing protein n=1 Tax=Scleromatobacter humisilvae TaxID=2897159 RepID=A0A9X2C3G9_9BURK|nr:DUF4386 domain-containing protein [Scleromatobacter humisilvae]MCK9688189.1 DUF4386 domain-containing protein [Scleromatobacter humisilvae]
MSDNKRQARIAGLLYLLVAVTAPVGLMVVPAKLVIAGDAAATAALIHGHDALLRLGMASELFHQAVEVFMVLVLYNLFKPVSKVLAQQMLVLGLIPIPMVFLNVLGDVAAATFASPPAYLAVLGKPQLDALALLLMHLHAQGLQLAAVFWGLWLLPFGLLAIRCGFIPKVFGGLVIASGLGYLLGSFTALIAPQLADSLATPVFVLELGEPMMILWLALAGATRGQAPARAGTPARAAA